MSRRQGKKRWLHLLRGTDKEPAEIFPLRFYFLFLNAKTFILNVDVDSSTNTTVGCTNNTPKPNFFEKRTKIIQNAKTQKRLEIFQN